MFTGLVEKLAEVSQINYKQGFMVLTLRLEGADQYAENLGDSIAVNGCCLTVTAKEHDSLCFDLSQETLSKTTFAQIQLGSQLNLERALRVGDRLGGHLVSGHVDTTAPIQQLTAKPGGLDVWIDLPVHARHLIIDKGSITVDGISLTINEIQDLPAKSVIRLTLIPQTLQVTSAKNWQVGQLVNIEFDMMGKYLSRYQKQ